MKDVDQRPNTELTKQELIRKIYRLEEANEELLEKLNNSIKQAKKPKMSKHYVDIISELRRENAKLRNDRATILTLNSTTDEDFVCAYFNIPKKMLKGKDRRRAFCRARCALIYIKRTNGVTYKEIGRLLNRDHASIINLLKKYDQYLDEEVTKQLNQYIYGNNNKGVKLQGSDTQTP